MPGEADLRSAAPLAGGRYLLVEQIGEGGMATVWRAWDTRLQVPRAIKLIPAALAGSQKLRKRFEAEARTMAMFDHPNIVRILDLGLDGEVPYLVMELMSGGSLLERLERHGPLHPRLAMDVLLDVLRALQAAHERGIVHRDIKPHNVLLTASGGVRLTDFGIARLVEDRTRAEQTRTGKPMGTWSYMAPEQKDDARTVDPRADLYGAGATLWAMLRGGTPGHLFAADLNPSMLEDLPGPVLPFVRRATRYAREERFPDAASMLEEALRVRDLLPPLPPDALPLVVGGSGQAAAPEAGSVTMVPEMASEEDSQPIAAPAPPEPATPRPPDPTAAREEQAIATEEPRPSRAAWWAAAAAIAALAFLAAVRRPAEPLTAEPLAAEPLTAEPVAAEPLAAEPLAVEPLAAEPLAAEAPPAEPAPNPPAPVPAAAAASALTTPAPPPLAPPAPAASVPSLEHTPVRGGHAGEAVTFEARIRGGDAWDEVILAIRPAGTAVYTSRPMRRHGDRYAASLLISGDLEGGFEYFILAKSTRAAVDPLTSGRATEPWTVAVR